MTLTLASRMTKRIICTCVLLRFCTGSNCSQLHCSLNFDMATVTKNGLLVATLHWELFALTMDHFSRRSIPAPSVSYSVHKGKVFFVSILCASFHELIYHGASMVVHLLLLKRSMLLLAFDKHLVFVLAMFQRDSVLLKMSKGPKSSRLWVLQAVWPDVRNKSCPKLGAVFKLAILYFSTLPKKLPNIVRKFVTRTFQK